MAEVELPPSLLIDNDALGETQYLFSGALRIGHHILVFFDFLPVNA